MDSDNKPSTSKTSKSTRPTTVNKQPNTVYPVTFEEFKNFTNVEEFVLKEMEHAGPEIRRINYKIRHKYYPVVYKQFYASHAVRSKLLRSGLTLKPIPKFLKEKLLLMPGDVAETCMSTNKHRKKTSIAKSREETHTSYANKVAADNNNKKPTLSENKKSSKPYPNRVSTMAKSSAKLTPSNDRIKDKPLAAESKKITNFFSALALSKTSVPLEESESNQCMRKRKSDLPTENAETKPEIKRLKELDSSPFGSGSKNKNIVYKVIRIPEHRRMYQSDSTNENSIHSSNLQIAVDMPAPINIELNHTDDPIKICSKPLNKVDPIEAEPNDVMKSQNIKSNENHRREQKRKKRKSKEGQHKNQCKNLDEVISDDSDIRSNIEIVDLTHGVSTGRNEVCASKCLAEKVENSQTSPLPRRNRIEDFKIPTVSPQKVGKKKKAPKQERLGSSDSEMALLSISGVDTGRAGRTTKEIHEWLEQGQNALECENDDEVNTIEYISEEYTAIDRLKAIKTYPEEVRKYIKYLLNLEIQKRKGQSIKPTNPQQTSKSKVVSAFLQMTFGDYKNLINAEKLLLQRLAAGESMNSITTNLKKQYESIIKKESSWPKGLHIKLSALKKYLRTKGVCEPIQLKDIPPQVLCFEEVLENTNLKECTSLSREKPPDSYKNLLDLCKKDYMKCCEEGDWIEGMKFTKKANVTEQNAVALESSISESISMPPLRMESDLSNTPNSLKRTDMDCNANNKKGHTDNAATENIIDNVFNEFFGIMPADPAFELLEKLISADAKNALEKTPVSLESHEIADKLNESLKHSSKCSLQITGTTKQNNIVVGKSSEHHEEIEKCLDEIFKESDGHNQSATNTNSASFTLDYVPPNSDELKRTLSENFNKKDQQFLDMLQTSGEQRTSEEVNAAGKTIRVDFVSDSLECSEGIAKGNSAGQPFNNIIQPAHTTPVESFKTFTKISNVPPRSRPSKPQESPGSLPLSPNLFQSSGENDPKFSQSQQSQAQIPETVYVPCKQNMTFYTEENNVTALSIDHSSDNADPFADTSTNQEDTIVDGKNVTTLPTVDPTIVKQENLSMPHATERGSYLGLDDSIEIIDVPPPEPIVIEDEETAPDLLEILLSRTTKTTNRPNVLNLTHLPSFSCLENFPQAQQLPSNCSLIPSQSNVTQPHGAPSMLQALGDEKTKQSAEMCDDIKFLKFGSPCERVHIDIIVNLVKSESQESNFPRLANKISDKSREDSTQTSNEISLSGSPAEVSYVSIDPQSIPCEIDLTQDSSTNTSHPRNSEERQCGSKRGVSSTVTNKVSEHQSLVEDTLKSVSNGSTDQKTLRGTRESEDSGDKSVESIKDTQESLMSVYYVYVANEAMNDFQSPDKCENIEFSTPCPHDQISKDDSQETHLESSTNVQDAKISDVAKNVVQIKNTLENVGSSRNIEHPPAALHESVRTSNIPIVRKNTEAISSLLGVAKQASECLESSMDNFPATDERKVKSSTNPSHAEICNDKVDLLKCSEKDYLQSSANIQNVETSDMTRDFVQDTAPLRNTFENAQSSTYTQTPTAKDESPKVEIFKDASNANISENNSENDESCPVFLYNKDSDSSEVQLLEKSEESAIQGAGAPVKAFHDHVISEDKISNVPSKYTEESSVSTEESKRVELSRSSLDEDTSKSISYVEKKKISEQNERKMPMEIQDTDVLAMNIQETVASKDVLTNVVSSLTQQVVASMCDPKSVESTENMSENVDSFSEEQVNMDPSKDLNDSEATYKSNLELFEASKRTEGSTNNSQNLELDTTANTKKIQKARTFDSQEPTEIVIKTTKTVQRIRTLTEHYPNQAETTSTELTKDLEVAAKFLLHNHTNKTQECDTTLTSSEFVNIAVPKQTAGDELISHTIPPSDFCGELPVMEQAIDIPEVVHDINQESVTVIAEQIEETINTLGVVCNRQPFKLHKLKTYNIPALLPFSPVPNDEISKVITAPAIIEGLNGESESEDLIEVPFLIGRRFIDSLPFNIEKIPQINKESTIYAIKVNFELKLEEHCVPTKSCAEHVEVFDKAVIADQEAQLSPTIHRCQFDEKIIKDWLGNEAIPSHTTTSSNVQSIRPEITKPQFDKNAQNKLNHDMCSRNIGKSPETEFKDPLEEFRVDTDACCICDNHIYSDSPILPGSEKHTSVRSNEVQYKTKLIHKTKKKITAPKKFLKKLSDLGFVPQKTHAFRSLPLEVNKKPIPIDSKQLPLTTEEEIDYVIEDASLVVASSTASQILGTDCTYFEGSQLLRNIEDCVPELLTKEQDPSTEPQVNTFNRTAMSEGIMARKVWQVNLQWKTKQKLTIEVRFVTEKRTLTVYDESAKFLFNFSPQTWSDVFKVLKEIDHFEYKRIASKNCRAVTPLHNVLRSLFDSAAQVVNIKLINDSFSPYVTCEKVNPPYRKPFQCLTKIISANVLSRIKALRQNLQNNTSKE